TGAARIVSPIIWSMYVRVFDSGKNIGALNIAGMLARRQCQSQPNKNACMQGSNSLPLEGIATPKFSARGHVNKIATAAYAVMTRREGWRRTNGSGEDCQRVIG